MMQPILSSTINADVISQAINAGLPQIGGKQVVAQARKCVAGQSAVNWYVLSDGTQVVKDDAGNATQWPED